MFTYELTYFHKIGKQICSKDKPDIAAEIHNT